MKQLPVWFQRVESLAIIAAVTAAFVHLHFAWYWPIVFFLAFDLAMVGYIASKKVGALTYNLVHSYTVPAVLVLAYVLSGTRWCAFVGLLWAFHVAVDRSLGYGLKFATGFQDTHLGKIGKKHE